MEDEFKARIQGLMNRMVLTKVIVTESIKTPRGDFFLGLSATVSQNDFGGLGADAMATAEDDALAARQGVSFQDEPLVQLLLGLQAAMGVRERAFLCGAMSEEEFKGQVANVQRNFGRAIKAQKPKSEGTQSG